MKFSRGFYGGFYGGGWFLLNEVFRDFGVVFWSVLESILELTAGSLLDSILVVRERRVLGAFVEPFWRSDFGVVFERFGVDFGVEFGAHSGEPFGFDFGGQSGELCNLSLKFEVRGGKGKRFWSSERGSVS